jgi:hypothetical protein
MAFPPECIRPPDGQDKQDGERVAGNRWRDKDAKHVSSYGVTLLGDDLSSNHPLCKLAWQKGCTFIFVCQPDSHGNLYERVAFWQATHAMKEVERRCRRGRGTEVTIDRSINEVCLRDGPGALSVHWFESTSGQATTGAQLSHNSCITNHPITNDNVVDLAQAGRGRWKSDNENNNVLKTKGDPIEQNFGHGKQYLAAFLLSLHLLAFLFHTVLVWCDDKSALIRHVRARRQTFFDDIRALTRYLVCESWHHLMDFMLRGLELEARLEAKLDTKLDTG